jgi:hypothetical protein
MKIHRAIFKSIAFWTPHIEDFIHLSQSYLHISTFTFKYLRDGVNQSFAGRAVEVSRFSFPGDMKSYIAYGPGSLVSRNPEGYRCFDLRPE